MKWGDNMDNIIDRLRNTRILAGIGIACLFFGTIFKYVEFDFVISTVTLSLWSYWEGKIVVLLALANLLFIFKDVVEKYVPSLFNTNLGKKILEINNPKASLVPTILATILVVYVHSNLHIDAEFATYGLGFYLLWVGVISLVAYAILHKNIEN